MKNQTTTVAFTGHRGDKILQRFPKMNIEKEIRKKLRTVINDLYSQQGYRVFITGMANGFDLWAGDTVLEMAKTGDYPDLQLKTAIPCVRQDYYYNSKDKKLYTKINKKCGPSLFKPAEVCSREVYLERNKFMVQEASHIVAFYFDDKSGTGFTMRYAQRMGCKITNIYDMIQ